MDFHPVIPILIHFVPKDILASCTTLLTIQPFVLELWSGIDTDVTQASLLHSLAEVLVATDHNDTVGLCNSLDDLFQIMLHPYPCFIFVVVFSGVEIVDFQIRPILLEVRFSDAWKSGNGYGTLYEGLGIRIE